MKLTYKDARGGVLGTLNLYKYEKPGQLAPEQELDPANPPKGELEYYIMTERTRVPGLVRKDTAQRMENDIETVFSSKPSRRLGRGLGQRRALDRSARQSVRQGSARWQAAGPAGPAGNDAEAAGWPNGSRADGAGWSGSRSDGTAGSCDEPQAAGSCDEPQAGGSRGARAVASLSVIATATT